LERLRGGLLHHRGLRLPRERLLQGLLLLKLQGLLLLKLGKCLLLLLHPDRWKVLVSALLWGVESGVLRDWKPARSPVVRGEGVRVEARVCRPLAVPFRESLEARCHPAVLLLLLWCELLCRDTLLLLLLWELKLLLLLLRELSRDGLLLLLRPLLVVLLDLELLLLMLLGLDLLLPELLLLQELHVRQCCGVLVLAEVRCEELTLGAHPLTVQLARGDELRELDGGVDHSAGAGDEGVRRPWGDVPVPRAVLARVVVVLAWLHCFSKIMHTLTVTDY